MKTNLLSLIILLVFSSCIKDQALKIDENTSPNNLNDGWEISTAEAENFDLNELQLAVELLFSEDELLTSKGLLIARNGKIILESYCSERVDQEELQNVKSVTKSVTSVVTGIAIQQNYLDPSVDKTIFSYIPENFDEDITKRDITVEYCLTMTTGLEDPFYAVNWYLGGNNVSTCLSVKLINAPGGIYEYNNGCGNILAGIIKKQTEKSFEQYTKEQLFEPLGITNYHWIKHEDGEVNAAFDLFLLPRDMLKFGQFCLQNGQWNGAQLLPQNWLAESSIERERGSVDGYGYHWWTDDNQSGYYAYGHGAQHIYIHPEKNLVIVHFAESSNSQARIPRVHDLIDRVIAAAE